VLVAKPIPEIRVSSVPAVSLRPHKPLPEQIKAIGAPMKTAERKKYTPPSGSLVDGAKLSAKAHERIGKLLPYNEEPLAKVDALPPDTFKLLSGLFAWLLYREDEALGKEHGLALATKLPVIRQKALAFTGWILADKGSRAAATLALARSLDGGDVASYDNLVLLTLSQAARDTTLAKVWPSTADLERVLKLKGLSPEAVAFSLLLLAERQLDRGAFAQARKTAQSIPAKTPWKEHGRYLASLALVDQKDDPALMREAGRELTELFRTVENNDVFDATAVTLGRLHFILGNYKAAHQYLSQVTRDTNVYIEAAVDNAWSLFRAGDRNNAVGNMFTLHTPYFEGAYMPESYFLTSLGYQESCQFGDAFNAVKQYKTHYADAYKKLMDFSTLTGEAYYNDLLGYLGQKEHKLPGIVLRELGRHPEFLRRQKLLNNLAHDETAVPVAFPTSGAKVIAWAAPDTTKLRAQYRDEIGRFMKARAGEMTDELKFLTANISLLEYEIYAGAGNNLALQGAKNFAVDEKKAVTKSKFEDGKEYWPYEDEIWEDELNNFRSKMVDACAHRG
jgi:hypothetical protein